MSAIAQAREEQAVSDKAVALFRRAGCGSDWTLTPSDAGELSAAQELLASGWITPTLRTTTRGHVALESWLTERRIAAQIDRLVRRYG